MSTAQPVSLDTLVLDALDIVRKSLTTGQVINAADCRLFPCPDCGEPQLEVRKPDFGLLVQLTPSQASALADALAVS
jgi:hypothetical protein